MNQENPVLFRYLFNVNNVSDCEKSFMDEINSDPQTLELLKDFDNFLRIYHRYNQNTIKEVFRYICMNIRFISLKIMIDSAVDKTSDEELVEIFGERIYEYMYNYCIELEYPDFRAEKYAQLYKNSYKSNIKFFLNDNH